MDQTDYQESRKGSQIETCTTVAFTATLHDHLVGEEFMVDYLLYHLNQVESLNRKLPHLLKVYI